MKKFLLIVALSLLLTGCGEVGAPVATPSPTTTSEQSSPSQFYTSVPTATPTPLSVQQRIANAIAADEQAKTFCFIVDAATTPTIALAGGAVTITSNLSSDPLPFSDDRAEECIFALEQDAWTSDPSATQVTVHVEILLQDQYGHRSTGDTAWAILKQVTERQLVWANLSYTQAWSDYDETWLLPGNT